MEIRNMYSSTDIIRMIKSRDIRWSGHVERMGVVGNAYKFVIWKHGRTKMGDGSTIL